METEKFEESGECEIVTCNEMNIPVNIFIEESEDDVFVLRADNFMPRKGYANSSQYEVKAENRETLIALVNKHVVPLYEAAITNLKTTGQNYYWEIKELTS